MATKLDSKKPRKYRIVRNRFGFEVRKKSRWLPYYYEVNSQGKHGINVQSTLRDSEQFIEKLENKPVPSHTNVVREVEIGKDPILTAPPHSWEQPKEVPSSKATPVFPITKKSYVDQASEIVERHFPKGETKTRGEALVVVAELLNFLMEEKVVLDD